MDSAINEPCNKGTNLQKESEKNDHFIVNYPLFFCGIFQNSIFSSYFS